MTPAKKRLVLIDGHAILHRAYYAFPATLKTRRGELVNAVYGFIRMLLVVLKELHPEYVAVAFDLPEPTFRHKEFIGYQVQRPKMDSELADQIERVKEVVRTLNIPIFAVKGFEADDVIGTLAKQGAKKGVEAVIVTGDRDIMQLVSSKVKVYAPVKGFSQAKLFGEKDVRELLGVKPEQIVDYKALVGDPSDNYPGVPGIGPKTAVSLLSRFPSFTQIYQNVGKMEPRLAHKLTEGVESATLSRKLAEIVTNVPIKLNLKACVVHDYDQEKAKRLFTELEFKSLIEKLPGIKKEEKKVKKKPKNEQMRLM
jgi:DNA polymerase-1